MANFKATIQGKSGATTRLGSKKSGMNCLISGWDCGVFIEAIHNNDNNTDAFMIFSTDGSSKGNNTFDIGRVVIENGKPTFISTQS